MSQSVYDFSVTSNSGSETTLGSYRAKVLLIVNTASNCGFTPQYKGLEALHQKYKDKGLVILGFPCDQFAHQEPGSNAEIAQFCQRNYGVSFPLMSKIDVNGKNAHPLFVYLRKQAPGVIGDAVKWNFTKFLLTEDGSKVKRFAPATEPEKLEKDLEQALGL